MKPGVQKGDKIICNFSNFMLIRNSGDEMCDSKIITQILIYSLNIFRIFAAADEAGCDNGLTNSTAKMYI